MNSGFSIQIKRKNLLFGIFLVVIGILSPSMINVKNFEIYNLLHKSIEYSDNGILIIAAFKLVMLNSIRALPHYLGTFIIAESINVKMKKVIEVCTDEIAVTSIIPSVYKIIYLIYGISYDLGVPAFMTICSIIYLEKLNFSTISLPKKSIIIILLLLGVQWMDIIPALSRFGFGRGEISKDIKLIASFINGSEVLTFAAIIFFCIFILNAFLISKILNDEHKLMVAAEINKRVERELVETRFKALEARNFQEMKSLVHDLKTPLTSVQGLASIAELMEKDERIKGYIGKIIDSIDILNKMISEILYEDKKSVITTEELFQSILSQISTYEYVEKIIYNNDVPQKFILGNKIRLSRAIINIIDNAYSAIDKVTGSVSVYVKYEDSYVIITIEDNGIGIEQDLIDKIWDEGFSTKNSTGLGLKFIRNIIENHQGSIEISSILNKGTIVKVILPEVIKDEE